MSELHLYNTLTRSKERFAPLEGREVRMYTCGPTVYSHAHLGNMRSYVFADLVRRTLVWFGWDVKQVVNITDVGHLTGDSDDGEDKMELAARTQQISIWEIAEKWTGVFQADLEKLNVWPPAVWCRATDHIQEQIELIQLLEEKGFTYATHDGIYFDTTRDAGYGALARLHLDAQRTQERIGRASQKRSPADFALWKRSPGEGVKRQMEWESPWGVGFPGWHIECSAMSTKYLGTQFDIHTGGIDHVPVHHPNEIAQSENAWGVRPWVQFWMHNGWLLFDDKKMAKSEGGIVTVDDLEAAGVEPLAYRYFLLGGHYRQQMSYSDDAIEGARASYQRLVRHAVELRASDESEGVEHVEEYRSRFRNALTDDLNTPQALAVVWEVVRSPDLGSKEKWTLLEDFDRVLGLGLAEAQLDVPDVDEDVKRLIEERARAREQKDWARADAIRDELLERGIVLEDRGGTTRWRRA
jgi:cysteinyl-tRNA synthetase